MTDAKPDPIEEARACAREAIREAWPAAEELARPIDGMFEFDAVYVNNETCGVGSVSIMHDPDVNAFALVENTRPKDAPKKEATAPTSAPRLGNPIDWDKLAEDHAIAYLRGDLAASSPESYDIEEMKAIANGMFASTAEADAAIREDFQSLPPREQAKLLELLQETDPERINWWKSLLFGEMPGTV